MQCALFRAERLSLRSVGLPLPSSAYRIHRSTARFDHSGETMYSAPTNGLVIHHHFDGVASRAASRGAGDNCAVMVLAINVLSMSPVLNTSTLLPATVSTPTKRAWKRFLPSSSLRNLTAKCCLRSCGVNWATTAPGLPAVVAHQGHRLDTGRPQPQQPSRQHRADEPRQVRDRSSCC